MIRARLKLPRMRLRRGAAAVMRRRPRWAPLALTWRRAVRTAPLLATIVRDRHAGHSSRTATIHLHFRSLVLPPAAHAPAGHARGATETRKWGGFVYHVLRWARLRTLPGVEQSGFPRPRLHYTDVGQHSLWATPSRQIWRSLKTRRQDAAPSPFTHPRTGPLALAQSPRATLRLSLAAASGRAAPAHRIASGDAAALLSAPLVHARQGFEARPARPVELVWRARSEEASGISAAASARVLPLSVAPAAEARQPATAAALPGATPAPATIDAATMERVAEDVLGRVEKRLRIERERRGI